VIQPTNIIDSVVYSVFSLAKNDFKAELVKVAQQNINPFMLLPAEVVSER